MPTAAKASLSSSRSRSAGRDALLRAGLEDRRWPAAPAARRPGRRPRRGRRSRPATASPSSSAFALLMTTTAAAPSEICEADPAVIVPSLAERRAQPAQRLGGGVAADALVRGERRSGRPCAAGSRPATISSSNTPFFCGRGGQLVRAGRERVLLLAGQAVALRCSSRSPRPIGDLVERAEQRVVGHRVDQRRCRRT